MLIVFLPLLIMNRPLFMARIFTGYARYLLKYVVGLDVVIEGKEHIPADRPFIIVSNHQSVWETLMFFTIFKDPVMLLKAELTRLPFFGWFLLRTGMISVNRKNPAKGFKQTLADINHRLKQEGRPVCVFPEGTRVSPTESKAFKKGIYLIYNHAKVDLLCVVHNAGLYWSPHKFIIKPGKVRLFIYPSLPPAFDEDTLKVILPGMIHTKAKELATYGE